jgi:ribonuclease BN (tRNA processing enzyme)
MKLTILGGAAAGPGAGVGCSGYLFQEGSSAIVVDLGPGTLPELKKHIDPRRLDGIVLSHVHLDHTLDIGALRYLLKYSPSPAESPVPMWTSPDSDNMLNCLAMAYTAPPDQASTFYDGAFDIQAFDPDSPLYVGEFAIRFVPCIHYVPTWAVRIESTSNGVAIGYTADTGPASNIDDLLRGVDVLVCEATLLDPTDEPFEKRGHLTGREAGELASRVGCRILVLTHMWEELDRNQIELDATRQFSGRIEQARPGLVIEI